MNRLTKKIDGVAHGAEGRSADSLTGRWYREDFECEALIEKLAEYEDAEENGLLMRFPCKPGEIYFAILEDDIREFEIKKIELCKKITPFSGMTMFLEPVYNRGTLYKFKEYEFGVLLFKTKEEAEEALKESRGK